MADDSDARTATDADATTGGDGTPDPDPATVPDPSDDDIDDYLDPELDPVSASNGDDSLPGPFSLSQLVRGFHFLTAGLITPFAWFAYQDGNLPQVASLGLLIALLLVAGVVTGRVTERRFG
jgi:VIT1/CCC1 family predicted Fe2+/Mn2+ transporter